MEEPGNKAAQLKRQAYLRVVEKLDNPEAERGLKRKITLRLLPLMFILYLFICLARLNVGFAAPSMNLDLQFDPEIYGVGAGIFFIGYFFLQIPGNLAVARFGVRKIIPPAMLLIGALVFATAWIRNPVDFYILRFLLGMAQTAFFPGMILYLSYWYPPRESAHVTALFITAHPLAGALGGPYSALLMKMNGILGFAGWRWIFIGQGIPFLFLGAAFHLCMADGPDDAAWLTDSEREWIKIQLKNNTSSQGQNAITSLPQALTDIKVWLLSLYYFCLVVGIYGICFWLPEITKGLFNLSAAGADMASAGPFLFAAAGMILIGQYSDRSGREKLLLKILPPAASLCFLGCVLINNPWMTLIFLALAALLIWGAMGPFWAYSGSFLTGAAAAAGIAVINSIGNLGGFLGPYIMGYFNRGFHNFTGGFLTLSVILFLGCLLSLAMGKIGAKE